MKCVFKRTEQVTVNRFNNICFRCNQTIPSPNPPERIEAHCRAWPFWWETGEWFHITLSIIGVTPRRWTWVSRKLGLIEPHQSCTCDAYREWLNTLGGKLATSTNRIAQFIAHYLIRRRPK